MIGKITKATVEKLALNSVLWDQSLIGFGARRQRKSAFYLIRYRIGGRQRFHSIGRHGALTPDTARREAQRLLGLVASKIDPAADTNRSGDNFGAVVSGYLDRRRSVLRPKTIQEIERHLMVQCRPLHRLRLGEIDRRTVAMLLADIEQHSGSVARNRVRASLSAMFNWSVREGLIDGVNPVAGTSKASEGNGRDRVLSESELASIWKATADPALGSFGPIVRLLILTAQRRTEVGSLRWSEIDLDQGLICLGADRVKNGREHRLPLSRQARAILEQQPRNGEFVFGAFNQWSYAKEQLDKRLVGVKEWCIHDVRRSATTLMAERLHVLPHALEAILNHYSGHRAGVAGIYNRARYADEMRAALQRWADHIDTLSNR